MDIFLRSIAFRGQLGCALNRSVAAKHFNDHRHMFLHNFDAKLTEAEAEVARLKDALRQASDVRDVFASAVVAQAMREVDAAKEKP